MAPEIVSSNDYSPAGDVWAFGCVLVHMGSGHTPYSHLKHLKEAKELLEVIKYQTVRAANACKTRTPHPS